MGLLMANDDFVWGFALGFLIGIPICVALLFAFKNALPALPTAPMVTPGANYVAVANTKTYTNTEEWEFIKDPGTGRVRGVRVKRTAKEN